MGPRLGTGAPEGTFQVQCRFDAWGSSILASLSRGGWERPVKEVLGKPFPLA